MACCKLSGWLRSHLTDCIESATHLGHCQAKVCDPDDDDAVRQLLHQDVVWLEVPVHEAL